jgi:hypothetical protein
MGQLYGVPRRERGQRADELLRQFRLWEKREVPFARLSRGMKRALTVVAVLVHRLACSSWTSRPPDCWLQRACYATWHSSESASAQVPDADGG